MLLTHYAIALTSAARVLGSLGPSEQPPSAPASKRGLKLDFDVLRGESIEDASIHKRGGVAKRSDGSMLMELTNLATFYQAVVYMGSNRDECKVLVSTDMSDLWVKDSSFFCGSPDLLGRDGHNTTVSGQRPHSTIHIGQDYDVTYNDLDYYTQHVPTGSYATAQPTYASDFDYIGETISPVPWPDLDPESLRPCMPSGSFDSTGSDTFKPNDTNFIFSIYNMNYVSGFYATDTVGFANASMELSFLVAQFGSISHGILGIGLPGNEASYRAGSDQYRNFPMQLKETGVIDKVMYSLYLNQNSSDSGSVLFGAVDHSKYSGQLQTVPMLELGEASKEHMLITLSGLYFENNGTSMPNITTHRPYLSDKIDLSNFSISDGGHFALFDSGATLQHLPGEILLGLALVMNGEYKMEEHIYKIDCSYKNHKGNLVYDFSGVHIKVPVRDFVYETEGQCFLGATDYLEYEFSMPAVVLGDSFLRHAYVVLDLEDHEVSIAQARYTDEEDVEAVVSTIPRAVKAPQYSSDIRRHQSMDATETGSSATSGASHTGSSLASATGSSGNSTGSAASSTSSAGDGTRAVVSGALAMGMVGAVLWM